MLPNTPTSLTDQLADIKEALEKEKIKLTPEVEEYIKTHLHTIQDKIADKKDITKGDLAFIGKVKTWILMPEEWREKYPTIHDLEASGEMDNMQNAIWEANKRQISIQQWLDMNRMIDAVAADPNLSMYTTDIDKLFEFKDGRIITINGRNDIVEIVDTDRFVRMPENFTIDGDLVIKNCHSFAALPKGLIVNGDITIENCSSFTTFPEGIVVQKDIQIYDCHSLVELPDNMIFNKNLYCRNCTSLTHLPTGLEARSLNVDGCIALELSPDELNNVEELNIPECTKLMQNKKTLLPILWQKINEQKIKTLNLGGWDLEDEDMPGELNAENDLNFDMCKGLINPATKIISKGCVLFRGCESLQSLAEGIDVESSLYLDNCKSLQTLPRNVRVGGNLTLFGCESLESLPDDLIVESILYLPKNPSEKLIQDAKELVKKGQVGKLYNHQLY